MTITATSFAEDHLKHRCARRGDAIAYDPVGNVTSQTRKDGSAPAVATTYGYSAGQLDPATLRTLDALHVATALELGDDLAGLVTYDDRLGEAAESHGIAVVAPR